jgi:transcriptional regulator with XRE-family HTH domain
MKRKAPQKLHYLPEWRAFKKLSLRRLAERLESEPGEELLSSTSLNRIEKGEQPLTPEVLHALAIAFDCAPEDIIGINPVLQPELIDFMAAARRLRNRPPEKILEATRVLQAIA